jgi:hypothetical protein
MIMKKKSCIALTTIGTKAKHFYSSEFESFLAKDTALIVNALPDIPHPNDTPYSGHHCIGVEQIIKIFLFKTISVIIIQIGINLSVNSFVGLRYLLLIF